MTTVFLVYVLILVPLGALHSARQVATGAELPPRRQLYLSGVVLQTVMLVLAGLAGRERGITLFPHEAVGLAGVAIGVGWVAAKYARFWWMYRQPVERAERRTLRHLVPRTPGEFIGYTALVTLASVTEELAYRVVLFELAARATGTVVGAAIASAVVFGVSHAVQGRKSAVLAGAIGLGNQGILLATGSVWIVIVTHFAYDIIVGVVAGRLERRAETSAAA